VAEWFDASRRRGADRYGDGADNLTGVVAYFSRP